jgi:hypothetical protein
MPELMNYGKSKQGGNTLHEGHRYDTMIVSVWDKSLVQRKRRTTHQKCYANIMYGVITSRIDIR